MNRYEHGGNRDGVTLDFSVNTNPLGMPQGVGKILADSIDSFGRYPDVNCKALRKAIAGYENVSAESILCGNGASDLIYRIVYAVKPKKALLIAPTFSEYERALLNSGCSVRYCALNRENGFTISENVLEYIKDDIDIFFLCNPNNPVGKLISPSLLEKIADKCRTNKICPVVDECFMDFVAGNEEYSAKKYTADGVIILKAFTKIFAMAGLRLGYIICDDCVLRERIAKAGACWSVSVPAQLAGIAAVNERDYIKHTVALVSAEREYLQKSLEQLGFTVYKSDANYILFYSELPLDKLLLSEKIAVRSCENYTALEYGYFRIAVKNHCENETLVRALERIKNG